MEITRGLGQEAQVWVDGHLLVVCDGVSRPDKRCRPGVLEAVKFTYVSDEGFSWDEAFRGNPGCKKRLDPVRGWSYTGYGQIVAIMPVVIDFGLLRMEDANWATDEGFIRRFVKIPIDRLDIGPADQGA